MFEFFNFLILTSLTEKILRRKVNLVKIVVKVDKDYRLDQKNLSKYLWSLIYTRNIFCKKNQIRRNNKFLINFFFSRKTKFQ